MSHLLFVCEGNAGRSLMAEMVFGQIAAGRHEARSAGTKPSTSSSPLVAEVMREIGIDVAERLPQKLTKADVDWADLIVIVGHTQGIPALSAKQVKVWNLPRIKGQPIEVVRGARDEIRELTVSLIDEL